MSHHGKMKKVGNSPKKMYGARKLLVCGYSDPEQQTLLSLLKKCGLSIIPAVFVTNDDLQKPLTEVLESDDKHGQGEISEMKRAIIMSGFTQKQLHTLMEAYRRAKLPIQHWATLTPTSEKWPVADLLDELEAEAEAIRKKREK